MFESANAQYYAVKSDSATVRVEVPAAVVASFRKLFPVIPRDTIVRWEVFGPAKDYFFAADVGKQGASFDAKGEVEETVLEVRMNSLPKPVQRKIKKSVLKGWSASEPNPLRAYVNIFNNEIWYYIIVFRDPVEQRKNRDLLIEPDGKFFNPKFR